MKRWAIQGYEGHFISREGHVCQELTPECLFETEEDAQGLIDMNKYLSIKEVHVAISDNPLDIRDMLMNLGVITPEFAMKALTDAMEKDPEYLHSWFCNIKMAYIDTSPAEHEIANCIAQEVACRFMATAFGVKNGSSL